MWQKPIPHPHYCQPLFLHETQIFRYRGYCALQSCADVANLVMVTVFPGWSEERFNVMAGARWCLFGALFSSIRLLRTSLLE